MALCADAEKLVNTNNASAALGADLMRLKPAAKTSGQNGDFCFLGGVVMVNTVSVSLTKSVQCSSTLLLLPAGVLSTSPPKGSRRLPPDDSSPK
jgi:hypothetical protein